MEIQSNVKLASYTTYKTGGAADFLCECKNVQEVQEALKFAGEKKLQTALIGGGSNILISDDGFRGLVILNRVNGTRVEGRNITVGSGVPLAKGVNESAKAGLSGLEFLAGIPGTVGGAVVGNAGAWGHEISEVLKAVETTEGNIEAKDIKFSYRDSSIRDKIILSATFALENSESARVKAKIKEYLSKKISNQPKGLSCGSYFKNPKNDSAGRIIESLGFKGKKIGGAQVSENHANFIINTGNATSKDINELASKIKSAVKEKLGVELEEEVRYVGKF